MNRVITKIYVHCSYSSWGDIGAISSWHKERDFKEVKMINGETTYCGYHKLIYNSFPTSELKENKKIDSSTDGKIVEARPDYEYGAGVHNDNTFSLHVCYIGYTPTPMQLSSLYVVCLDWMKKYNIPVSNVLGHNEYYSNNGLPVLKTCPQIDMVSFRKYLSYLL